MRPACLSKNCACRFGEGLELVEQQWLVSEMNAHIESLGTALDIDSLPAPEKPKVFNDDEPDGFR